jgi:hypothetical protein
MLANNAHKYGFGQIGFDPVEEARVNIAELRAELSSRASVSAESPAPATTNGERIVAVRCDRTDYSAPRTPILGTASSTVGVGPLSSRAEPRP